MEKVIKFIAEIEFLNVPKGRTKSFGSGYRPLFKFNNASSFISGRIDLMSDDAFYPGEKKTVLLTFIKELYEQYGKNDKKFTFGEGTVTFGKGTLIELA